MAVDHDRTLDIKALRLWIDKKQRQAVALARGTGGACRDDQQIGDVAIDNECLRAGKRKTIAGALRRKRNLPRAVLGALVDRKRHQELTGGYLRQKLAFAFAIGA